ncbi:MAG: hypothetical protein U9Q85_01745 [Patescibacteria group bacterium]|nr:hypothetical protein [Patescibacteria group bacterium]
MFFNRFLPIIIAVSHLALLELILFFPKMLFVIIVFLILLDFFVIRQFLIVSKRDEKWWCFIILPLVFSLGLIIFSTLLPFNPLVQVFFLINSLFNYVYFSTIYYYLINPKKYQANSLENISSYGNFLGFYFIASSIYGLQVFLNIEIWRLIIFLLFVTIAIVYEVFWVNQVDNQARFFYILVLSLMIVELAWAISFMTLNYYVLGLILAIFYYTIIGLTRFYLLGTLNARIIKAYLSLGIASVILVLFTANWISYN